VKFPPTLLKIFIFFFVKTHLKKKIFSFKTVNSMKAQTHLSHFDEKMYLLFELNFRNVSNNLTPFLLWNSVKKSVRERICKEHFLENLSLNFFNSAFSRFFPQIYNRYSIIFQLKINLIVETLGVVNFIHYRL
jgi:hypothetical protein